MKIFSIILILFSHLTLESQVFIPFGFRQRVDNCTAVFCPTLNVVPATLQGNVGMTTLSSVYTDDSFLGITLPFTFYIGGTGYTNWFVGSNFYITAGTGSGILSPLNSSSPAYPKFMLGARDNAWSVLYSQSKTNSYRIRMEGLVPWNAGVVNSYYEFTFFKPTANYQFVQVVFGAVPITNPVEFGVANASTYYASTSPSITANTSYVMWSQKGGTVWTILPGFSISGTGTNL